jgi:hypothetical protein
LRKGFPIPTATLWFHAPHIELENTPAQRRTFKGFVGTFFLGQSLEAVMAAKVNGLENIFVQSLRFFAFETACAGE